MIKKVRRLRTNIDLDPIPVIEEASDNTRVVKPWVAPKLPSATIPVKRRLFDGNIINSNPAVYLGLDLVGKSLGLLGRTFTEKDLTDNQLKVIDEQVRHRLNETPYNENYFRLHPNDTIHLGINARTLYPEMYGRVYGSTNLGHKVLTPDGQVESILGDYSAKIYKDGYEASDIYDFNTGQGLYKGNNSVYAKVRRFAGKNGHTSEDPDSTKNKFSIKRKVNHW